MTTLEEVATKCISIAGVPNGVDVKVIQELVNTHLEGKTTDQWVEIPGTESDATNTRYVLNLQSERQAEKLSESVKEDKIEWNGQFWTVHFVRTIACEVPPEWRDDDDDDYDDLETDSDPAPSAKDEYSHPKPTPRGSVTPGPSGLNPQTGQTASAAHNQPTYSQQLSPTDLVFQDVQSCRLLKSYQDFSGQCFVELESGHKVLVVVDQYGHPVCHDPTTQQIRPLYQLPPPQPVYDVPSNLLYTEGPPPPYSSPHNSTRSSGAAFSFGDNIARDQEEIYQKLLSKQKGDEIRDASDEVETKKASQPNLTTATHVKVTNIPPGIYEDYLITVFGAVATTQIEVTERKKDWAILKLPTSDAANAILHQRPYIVKDQEMLATEYFPDKETSAPNNRTIQVIGHVSKDQVEWYFDSKKRSGVGGVEKIEELEDGVFWVTFEDDDAAQKAMNRVHKIGTEQLEVSLNFTWASESADGDGAATGTEPRSISTIVVQGVSCVGNNDTVIMYFENKRKSGGGELAEWRIDERDPDILYLTYEEPEVTQSVLSRSHTLAGIHLRVKLFEPIQVDDDNTENQEPNRIVKVKGASGVTPDVLEMYFESKRRSEGGDIDEIKKDDDDEDVVYITFKDEMAAQAVVNRQNHSVNNVVLEVSLFFPPKEPSLPEGPLNKVCVSMSIPLDKDTLEMYFESKKRSGGGDIEAVEIDPNNPCMAYITFEDEKVAQAVVNRQNHSVNNVVLEVSLYCHPKEPSLPEGPLNKVCVSMSTPVDSETLEMYFESKKRSGGGDIEVVEIDPNDPCMAYITFEDEEVAQAVVNQQNHSVNNASLNVSLFFPPKEPSLPEAPLNKVSVSMSTPLDKDTLEMYFESKKRSGGGDIEAVEIDPNDPCMAYITFEDEEVAERVANHSHKLGANELKVTLVKPSPKIVAAIYTIKVTGVGSIKSLDPVEMYFENKRRSGGGNITNIKRDEEDGNVAYITFENEEVLKSVCGRDNHRLNNQTLLVEPYSLSQQQIGKEIKSQNQGPTDVQDDSEEGPIRSVKIVGWSRIKSQESGQWYFENTRRSGGKDMETSLVDAKNPDILYITYKEEAVAQEVANRSPHTLEGHELVAILYRPPKPPPNYPDRVLVKGLGANTTKDCLFNFLEAKIQAVPVKLTHGALEGVVMVTFQDHPDFNKLQQISRMTLEGCELKLSPIPVSDCIYVTNVQESVSCDTLKFYFENHRRSRGGDVNEIVMVTEECAALVYFEDYKTVDNVLSQKVHEVDKQILGVQLYIESLGCAEGGDSELVFKLPNPIILQNVEEQKLDFLNKSSTLKAALDKQMSDCHTKINWGLEKNGIQLECTLTKDNPGCRKMAMNWKKNAEENFKDFLNTIKVEKLLCSSETWQDVLRHVRNVTFPNVDTLALIVSEKEYQFTVVGIGPNVQDVATTIRGFIKTEDEELEKRKSTIKDTITYLKKYQTKMLLANRFPNRIKESFPNVKVNINQNKNEILIEGTPSDVTCAKTQLLQEVSMLATDSLKDLPKYGPALYNEKVVKEYIIKKLKAQKLVAVWELSQTKSELTVSTQSEDTIHECLEMIRDAVQERQLPLNSSSRSVVQTDAWTNLTEQQQKLFPGRLMIAVDMDKVFVCATDDIIDEVVSDVQKFIGRNTVVTEAITLKNSIVQLIDRHEKGKIDSICQDLREHFVHISVIKGNAGYTIQGTLDGVAKAKQKLQEIISEVKNKKDTISKPGIGMHMKTSKGIQALTQVEKEYPVIIQSQSEDEEDDFDGSDTGGFTANQEVGLTLHAVCETYDNRRVFTGDGDMTMMTVDVLVNTADENLSLTGGLGKALVKKGGKNIETECKQYIADQGKLSETEAFVSKAGKLNAKYIVHVVGPRWRGGQSNEEDILEETVIKALQQASEKNVTSVALPAVSCGVLGYPANLATTIIVKAVKNFFREFQDTSISEVYLCDIKADTVNKFTSALSTVFGAHTLKKISQDQRPKSTTDRSRSLQPSAKEHHYRQAAASMPSRPASGSGTGPIQIGNITVTIVKGEIAKQKVDAIVNTTARNLDLKNGAVSASLSKVAGPDLQQEAQTNYPNGIKAGELAITGGHKLQCQKVLHCTLMNWDGGATATGALDQLVTICLTQADRLGLASIAMPAIGTGSLNFPRDIVAREMFKMVAQFDKKYPKTSVTDVRFIVYQKDMPTIKAFEQEAGSKYSEPQQSADSSEGEDEEPIYEEIDDVLARNNDQADTGGGHVQFSVRKGDITEEKCDCIVNSSNTDLDLTKGAVAKALLAKGGKKLEDEAKNKSTQMAKDHIVVTSAPGLKCKNIIHMVAQETLPAWKTLIDKVLIEAEKLKLTSIAFPALGTGMSMKAKDISKVMYQSIVEFDNTKPSHLKDIRCIIFQQAMVDDFCKGIEKASGMKAKKTGLGAFWSTIKSALGNSKKKSRQNVANPLLVVSSMKDKADVFTVVVYGMNLRDINDAIKRLRDIIDKETMKKTFETSVIQKMDKNMVTELMAVAKQHHVSLQISHATGKIDIEGLPQNVMAVNDKVHSHIRTIEQDQSFKEHALLLSNIVQWYYIDVTETGQNLVPYEVTINQLIETAFKKQEQSVQFSDKDGEKFKIDFNTMEETLDDGTGDKLNVIRRDLLKEGAFEPPSTWKTMSSNLLVVQLQPADSEYKDILDTFLKSAGQNFNVTRIDRIQNKTLWQQYQAKKKQLESQNKSGTQNERLLWHGTAVEGVDSINTHGFNRSYCGKNATYYGEGVYFAVNASYSCSDTYSRPDKNKIKRMYYCHVLTGEYTLGKQNMRVPPIKDIQSQSLYDSVVENIANPNMFIIFHDTQAYPEYLIYFTTAYGDGVYFAVQAAYSCSHTYSRPDASGMKRVYYCRVLTGEYTLGQSGIRVPPVKRPGSHDLFDSVVNNIGSPVMFIIFNDTQAYPEYLIHFK